MKKHEYLEAEDYYENNPVGTRGRAKVCEHCDKPIKAGQPHDVHKFYPDFSSYPTHKTCSDEFIKSLN